jgi:hypothetical protein
MRLPCLALPALVLAAVPVAAQNLLANHDFATDLAGWDLPTPASWVGDDGDPSGSGSGCAEVASERTNGGGWTIAQSVPVTEGASYSIAGWAFVPAADDNVAEGAEYTIDWHSDTAYLSSSFFGLEPIRGEWIYVSDRAVAPPRATYARVGFGVRVPVLDGGEGRARWDDVYFGALLAAVQTAEYFVPGSAYTPGLNGTFWTTDLTVYNPLDAALTVEAAFLSGPGDNSGASFATLGAIDPGHTAEFLNVVATLGKSGNGALRLRCSAAADRAQGVIVAHTWTPAAAGGGYGLGAAAQVVPSSERSVVGGLRQDGAYRTNVGVVNPTSAAADVELIVVDATGDRVADVTWTLGPYGARQASLASLGVTTLAGGSLVVQGANVLAYASPVDNATGDSTYLPARPVY